MFSVGIPIYCWISSHFKNKVVAGVEGSFDELLVKASQDMRPIFIISSSRPQPEAPTLPCQHKRYDMKERGQWAITHAQECEPE